MTQELRDLIEQVAAGCRTFYHEDLQPPATEAALDRLQQRAQEELGASVPEGYLDFLRVTDGLNWEGLFVYASDKNPVAGKPTLFMHSFVDDNLDWRSYAPHCNYLFFADGDISLFAYNLAERRYEIQDRPSGTVMGTFDTFDAMIAEALRNSLREDEDEDEESED